MEKDSHSYLLFNIQDIKLGINILSVREIISPEYLQVKKGVPVPFLGEVNLRNAHIPVMGLHELLGVPPPEIGARSRILIMEQELNWFGIMVDAVLEMAELESDSFFSIPQKFTDLDLSRFLGMAKVKDELFYFFNPDKVATMGELNRYYRMKIKS